LISTLVSLGGLVQFSVLGAIGDRLRALCACLQVVFLHPKDNDGVLMELEEVGHKA
jgi:hypothetical protein